MKEISLFLSGILRVNHDCRSCVFFAHKWENTLQRLEFGLYTSTIFKHPPCIDTSKIKSLEHTVQLVYDPVAQHWDTHYSSNLACKLLWLAGVDPFPLCTTWWFTPDAIHTQKQDYRVQCVSTDLTMKLCNSSRCTESNDVQESTVAQHSTSRVFPVAATVDARTATHQVSDTPDDQHPALCICDMQSVPVFACAPSCHKGGKLQWMADVLFIQKCAVYTDVVCCNVFLYGCIQPRMDHPNTQHKYVWFHP